MNVKLDEGMAFGLGVFETIRIERGKAILLQEHISRMRCGIRQLGIEREEVNRRLAPERICDWIKERSMKQGALKIIVTEKIFCLQSGRILINRRTMRKVFILNSAG